jgi:hypothetical protein
MEFLLEIGLYIYVPMLDITVILVRGHQALFPGRKLIPLQHHYPVSSSSYSGIQQTEHYAYDSLSSITDFENPFFRTLQTKS